MESVKRKNFIEQFTFVARNLRSKEMFKALARYCQGNVLDVGGRDFYLIAKTKKINFHTWTNLEVSGNHILADDDKDFKTILGDGCALPLKDKQFDTILNIQVLEHVLEPLKMMSEMSRVLKPRGHGIFLIPQTSVLHELPHHYYNFTRFWVTEAAKVNNLEILELKPLGGVWSSMASHLVYFFFQSIRAKGFSTPECKRNILFYLFYPFMCLYALISIPMCMIFSLGDLTEEPNNYLVVVQKR